MRSKTVGLFAEDQAQESIVSSLVERLARERGVVIQIRRASMTGNLLTGHGSVKKEFRVYLRDLGRDKRRRYDLVIVATDANCLGFKRRLNEMKKLVENQREFSGEVAFAIPYPHVERWLLLDSAAFRDVLGHGCSAPDSKCAKDRYKELLRHAVHEATGLWPDFGGIEFAQDIVKAIDFGRVRGRDKSLDSFLDEVNAVFNRWSIRPMELRKQS